MTRLGLPVPPGFTISTEACRAYLAAGVVPEGLFDQVNAHLGQVEGQTGEILGDPHDPLLLSVRSGGRFSMPGMMDTVLDIGLNDASVAGLARQSGDPRFAWDSYRRLIHMFGKTVCGVPGEAFERELDAHKSHAGVAADAARPRTPLWSRVGWAKTCVCGAEALEVDAEAVRFTVDGTVVSEGDVVSTDGATGEVFLGAVPVHPSPVVRYFEGEVTVRVDRRRGRRPPDAHRGGRGAGRPARPEDRRVRRARRRPRLHRFLPRHRPGGGGHAGLRQPVREGRSRSPGTRCRYLGIGVYAVRVTRSSRGSRPDPAPTAGPASSPRARARSAS
ncbi:hypothetical protein Prum_103350 [Phytohabitans rumicis]|uniref:Pyruvate phosphate dikinase AMP/ATP-binding domain-containing protein n=1 Tax=Phytohabitans rumicis TaxID=1076125 RepID=A0A6V8LHG8_9ACTN|nr:hypothetical protein Prum_103350 [Phytohabitans rumicis]